MLKGLSQLDDDIYCRAGKRLHICENMWMHVMIIMNNESNIFLVVERRLIFFYPISLKVAWGFWICYKWYHSRLTTLGPNGLVCIHVCYEPDEELSIWIWDLMSTY